MDSDKLRKKITSAILIFLAIAFCLFGRACGDIQSTKTTSETIDSPVRISAAATNDTLAVSDYYLQKILLINKTDLTIKASFTIAGHPTAVAFRNGLFYVGNETTGSVEIYNSAGILQGDLGGAGTIKMPQDIAFDEADQKIFVVDGFARIVKIFDFDGTAQGTLPGAGFNRDILAFPTAVSVDPATNQVFVSDYGDMSAFPSIKPKIQIFDYSGAVTGTFWGASGGFIPVFSFSRPQGSVLDPTHLFLVDSLLGQVLVLDRASGGVATTLGSFGSGSGQLLLPIGIYMDNVTKDIYVTDNRNQRITVFRGGGAIP